MRIQLLPILLGTTIVAATLIPAIAPQPSNAQPIQLNQWRWTRAKPKPPATPSPSATLPASAKPTAKPNANPTAKPTANPTPVVTPSQPPLSPLAKEMIASHNQVRTKVGVGPLTWSPSLAAYAQEWANKLAKTGQFEHRQNSGYGENLYWGQGRTVSPSNVVTSWANEVSDYNYDNNNCRDVCGHYTQIVWKNTTEVGCAVAKVRNEEYWVCNYNPPGNYVGQKPY
jgi:uncharacterized protein YkwD